MRNSMFAATAIALIAQVVPVQAIAQTVSAGEPGAESEGEDEVRLDSVSVTGSFLGSGSQSAMKMNVSILDTPFTVSSYSEDFIKSLDTSTLDELFNYMAGVAKAGNTAYDVTLRGFKAGGDDRNSLMVDGMPGLAGRFGSPPTVGVERVEVIKGPMSVLYGQNQPGGFINLVTKKPQEERSAWVDFKASTFAGDVLDFGDTFSGSVAFDITGPMDSQGRFLYRLVAEVSDKEGFRTATFDEGVYLAPSLTWNITPRTSLTGQLEYRDTKASFDVGLVVPNRDMNLIAPITTRYSEPDNFREENGLTAALHLKHTFDNGLVWNTSYRNVAYDSAQQEFSNVTVLQRTPGGPFVVNRRARELTTERSYDFIDSNLSASFRTGSLDHQFLVGVNYGWDEINENRLKFFNANCSGPMAQQVCFDIDVYNPVYGQVPAFDSLPATNPNLANQEALLTNRFFESDSLGFYVSDLISIGNHFKLSLGARSVEDNNHFINRRDPTAVRASKKTKADLVPSVGLLYQPNDNWTLYTSYTESYFPVDPTNLDENGDNPFDPVEGVQYEAGVKTGDLFDGRLDATLSVFQIDQKNTVNAYQCPAGTPRFGEICYAPVGEVRSTGFEAEAGVSPLENWQIIAGYSYVDAKVTSTFDLASLGQPLANVAKHSGALWSRYDWDNGFGMGIGVSYTGDRPALLPRGSGAATVPYTLPAYTLVDLALYYQKERFQIGLKVGNLLDETYYQSAGFTAQIQTMPGAPRSVTLSTRVNF